MGLKDKVEQAVGKAKEGIGEATGNNKLRREGQADQVKGKAGEVAHDADTAITDKLGDAKDAVTKDKKHR